jgi:hypothetical protein
MALIKILVLAPHCRIITTGLLSHFRGLDIMSDEKSAVDEINGFPLEDAAAELPGSPGMQPDVGLSVAGVEGVGSEPELASLVASSASQCSEDPAEMAEAVYMGRLEPAAAMLFQAHFETCPCCLKVYGETVEFVFAISTAAKGLELIEGSEEN